MPTLVYFRNTSEIMKNFRRIIRAVWISAVISTALLTSADVWADLTVNQADALQAKVAPGDEAAAALETLITEARQGSPYAQLHLGSSYYLGLGGVPQDYRQAAQWWRKAAEQGNDGAQYDLGLLYCEGRGIPRNKVVAYALFNLSAAQEYPGSNRLASSSRSKLANDMTEREIEAGQELTRQMSIPGNFLRALDKYLTASGSQ